MKTSICPRQLALDLCERSICKVKMAAVLSDPDGRIFAWGWNHPGPDSLGMHAEEMALSRANRTRVRGATITVAGFRRRNLVKSRPCLEKCFPRIVKAGVARVEYHTKEGVWKTMLL